LLNDQARWLAKSKWSGIARTAGEDAGPRVWTRDMLSGEKVVDDQQKYAELVTRLKSAHRKIAGVEMEGHGVGAAAKSWRRREVEFLFVKGVSDYAFDKTDSQRELAKKNAADFLFELLDDFDGD
jgi:nucleoside phosphorylase